MAHMSKSKKYNQETGVYRLPTFPLKNDNNIHVLNISNLGEDTFINIKELQLTKMSRTNTH